jgi:hypothetical protein
MAASGLLERGNEGFCSRQNLTVHAACAGQTCDDQDEKAVILDLNCFHGDFCAALMRDSELVRGYGGLTSA